MRLDKWVFCARLARTRALAAEMVSAGRFRINRRLTTKPAQPLRVGDVLTMRLHGNVRMLEVRHLAERRLGADEAQALYLDIS